MTTDRRVCVEDVVRGQWSPLRVEEALLAAATRDGRAVTQDVPQDPGQAGKAQVSALAALLSGFDVHFSPESGSKEHRAAPFAAQVAAGNVSIVRAPWNDAFVSEAAVFPNGAWMDQIDAASRAYAKLLLLRAYVPTLGAPVMVR